MESYVIKLEELGMNDVETVGGKNASLGEMISNLSNLGVTVPGGFATTAAAYRDFLRADGLDKRINEILVSLDVNDISALAAAGEQIRNWILETPLPQQLMDDINVAEGCCELATDARVEPNREARALSGRGPLFRPQFRIVGIIDGKDIIHPKMIISPIMNM